MGGRGVADDWAARKRRMRRMLDAQISCDGRQRSGTVTWIDDGGLVVLTGRPLALDDSHEIRVSLDSESVPVLLTLTVRSVHKGSENPHGIGALHVCSYNASGPKDQQRIGDALPGLHPTSSGKPRDTLSRDESLSELDPESLARSATVTTQRPSVRGNTEREDLPVKLAFDLPHSLFAPGPPASMMVSFRGWDEVGRCVLPTGNCLRLALGPVPSLGAGDALALVVQLPSGIPVQLSAHVLRSSGVELVVETQGVPPWARVALRLEG